MLSKSYNHTFRYLKLEPPLRNRVINTAGAGDGTGGNSRNGAGDAGTAGPGGGAITGAGAGGNSGGAGGGSVTVAAKSATLTMRSMTPNSPTAALMTPCTG